MPSLRFVIALIVILTLLSAVESFLCPWSPYFIVYAILAIIIPLYFKTYKVKRFDKTQVKLFVKFLIVSVLVVVLSKIGYVLILKYLSLRGNPFYDINYALLELGRIVNERFGISVSKAMLIYAFYIIVWAPIGEELLYRGFLFEILNRKYSFAISALVSSLFFGVRHLVHFLLLPKYPVFAGLFYFYIAFVYGLIMAYAYKKTENIYIPMGLHLLTNIISAFMRVFNT
ncbi:CPBP family intramembrane glutamic endopeptidase [Methanotorris formicicus]|uniref:Abortive infection protein n=1 Tax=Methanotorris formicicus Mc-S-70 TaxID=647171 RepID=H1L025_9EURY|nr:type II CAAX endopeptidase family protein [Methanotorris formicicus]EHP85245.1 Abortive infection protein [Methanotorris formicicus Mc-S-70]